MDLKEHARRRKRLMAQMGKNSIAIVPSAHEAVRSRDTHYLFRQDSDFWYLTGYHEPDSVLVLIPGRAHGEVVLFNRERDPAAETWHGRRTGQEGAIARFGFDDAFPIADIDEILPGLLEGRDQIHYAMGVNAEFDAQVMAWVNTLRGKVKQGALAVGEMVELRHLLHDMRLFKSAAELKAMRHAAETAAKAHCRAMCYAEPGRTEAQMEAEILHEFALHGCRHPAYNCIVAGGENACILHYNENDQELKDGELLLIDAGAEYQGYASDITRTFPVNGKFSAAQRAVYGLVLKAQLAAIAVIRPGIPWSLIHETSVRVLTEGLVELGILKGRVADLLVKEAHKPYSLHKTGHWIGLDVHDVGDYTIAGESRILEPGMVLTVEPGLYFAPGTKGLAKKWQGMGVRIEDDVLVTKTGHEVLSHGVPKDIESIEALMAEARRVRGA
ncbi:MAG: Xaa-Pro aminopeptidase [Gammaproteobacteria bacterium]|nr:Xaa-Pro aminopeptidase [Gammaproteobacteria bacterium]